MKCNNPSVSLVIPIYNNEASLKKQLDECIDILERLNTSWEIIVSNDASTDNTARILLHYGKNKKIKIYHQKKNKGIADNLKFLYGKAEMEYICLFSIDGDWNPNDISRMFKKVSKTGADIVIGERVNKSYSLYRHVVSYFYTFLPLIAFQCRVIDPGSIKMFRKELFLHFPIQSLGVFFEAEMIIKAIKRGSKVMSIPIIHTRRYKAKQTGGQLRYIIPSIKDIIRLRLRGLRYEY